LKNPSNPIVHLGIRFGTKRQNELHAGLFPGCNYLISGWYKRSEFGLRASIFFSAATISGAFGGLLSFAINKMDGVGNYAGWRWIFILSKYRLFLVRLETAARKRCQADKVFASLLLQQSGS